MIDPTDFMLAAVAVGRAGPRIATPSQADLALTTIAVRRAGRVARECFVCEPETRKHDSCDADAKLLQRLPPRC